MSDKEIYDSVIIGYGPAGCTAGIFTKRRGMKVVIIGDPMELSQVEEATVIDDWPGEFNISGAELISKFREHVKKLDVEVREERALSIEKTNGRFLVRTDKSEYAGKTVIIATGSRHRKAMIKGEEEFSGKGVSYCATCDAPLFRGKRVIVIGGGDSAVTYAILLKDTGAEPILVHRRDELRAAEYWQDRFRESGIKALWNSVVTEIKGDKRVKSVLVKNVKTGKEEEVTVEGVFVAIGTVPTSEIARNIGVNIDERGFIKVDRNQKTNVPGVFAAGDCCDNPSKKIVTAAGDGAVAGDSAYYYLKTLQEGKKQD